MKYSNICINTFADVTGSPHPRHKNWALFRSCLIFTARKRSFGQGNIYHPQRSWGKVIFSQASVILFTGGVCLSACWVTTPRPGPPGPDTPLDQAPPGTRHPPVAEHTQSGQYASYWNAILVSHACVIPLVYWGGGGFPACIIGHMTKGVCIQGGWAEHPPRTLQDTVNKQAVCILLECILVPYFFVSLFFII